MKTARRILRAEKYDCYLLFYPKTAVKSIVSLYFLRFHEKSVNLRKYGFSICGHKKNEAARFRTASNPTTSPAQRVAVGGEEQRNERALTFEKSRSKRYEACDERVDLKRFGTRLRQFRLAARLKKSSNLFPFPFAGIKKRSRTFPYRFVFGGPEEIRTLDLSDANRTLSQLSYRPKFMLSRDSFQIPLTISYYTGRLVLCQAFFAAWEKILSV